MICLPCVCSGVAHRSSGASCAIYFETDVYVCVWELGMQQDPEGKECDSHQLSEASLLELITSYVTAIEDCI